MNEYLYKYKTILDLIKTEDIIAFTARENEREKKERQRQRQRQRDNEADNNSPSA